MLHISSELIRTLPVISLCFPLTSSFHLPTPSLKNPEFFNIVQLRFKQFFLNIYLFYLFIFWLCWVFVAPHGLSLVAASRGYSSLRCVGFSLRWLLLLRSMGSRRTSSVVVARGLSSCGTWAQ